MHLAAPFCGRGSGFVGPLAFRSATSDVIVFFSICQITETMSTKVPEHLGT